jgi:hypothetical protein
MKMLKSNAPGTYGIKNCPLRDAAQAPMIASANPEAVRQIANSAMRPPVMHGITGCGRTGSASWAEKHSRVVQKNGGRLDGRNRNRTRCIRSTRVDDEHIRLERAAAWGFKYLSCTRAQSLSFLKKNGLLENTLEHSMHRRSRN